MNRECKICRHPLSAEIVGAYFAADSLRVAARIFGISYKTLHRHLQNCLAQTGFDNRERDFQRRLSEESARLMAELKARYNAARLDRRRPRPQPMVTKPVEYNWSRRGWSKSKTLKT